MDSELNRHAFIDIFYESMSDNSSISGLAVDLRKGSFGSRTEQLHPFNVIVKMKQHHMSS